MAKRSIKSKLPMQEVLGVVAGSVAAGLAGKLVSKFMPSASPTVQALVPVGLGVFLAGMKQPIVKGAGYGMIAKGGADLVEAFMPSGAAVKGVEDLFMNGLEDYVSLPADQSILSLPADQSILSGMDDEGLMSPEELEVLNGSDEY